MGMNETVVATLRPRTSASGFAPISARERRFASSAIVSWRPAALGSALLSTSVVAARGSQ